jgi:hypothetical protein
MKTIALVQASLNVGPANIDSYVLPYSVGCLWAYIQQTDLTYNLKEIIVKRENIDSVANRLSDVDIVCFSLYVWNAQYSYALAKKLKQLNPKCITIWGGPELPITHKDVFVKHPYIDYIVKKEGEVVFADLLADIDNAKNIKGLLVNDNGKIIDTGDSIRITNLDTLPSPYLTGVFDKLIEDNPQVEWNAIIETNRGCPYACTFCDWGSLTYSKVKKFPIDRVFAEIEWAGRHNIYNLSFADANFGIFVERDSAIADKIVQVEGKYGYPKTHTMTWAKNQKPETLDIVKKLSTKNLTVSAQSMSLDVLDNIKRRNLDQHQLVDIFKKCERAGVRPETEMILGLPGETLQSWKSGIYQLFDYGNHTGINIYQCQLLENSELNLQQRSAYGIESVAVYDNIQSKVDDSNIEEVINVVKSTRDITYAEMLDACIFNTFIQSYHVYGITNMISRVLNKQYKIGYEVFYTGLFDYLIKDDWFAKEIQEISESYNCWFTTGRLNLSPIGGLKQSYMTLGLAAVLRIIVQNKFKHVQQLIHNYLKTLSIHNKLINQLVAYQFDSIIDPYRLDQYPMNKSYDYSFYDFVIYDEDLFEPVAYTFEYAYGKQIVLDDYCARLWYDRKRNFGRAQVKRVEGGLIPLPS